MPSSSTSRPAVRNVPSPQQYVTKLNEKAAKLEGQLNPKSSSNSTSAGGTSISPAQADKLRTPLCEALADLILTDASFAAQHSAPERLWRGCFYSKISLLRAAVHKQRRKLAKLQASAGNSANTSATAHHNQHHDALLKAQLALADFLKEAIQLYQYLWQKLQAKLAGPAQDGGKTGGGSSRTAASSSSKRSVATWSEDSASNNSNNNDPNQKNGIVICMHYLALHFGDLYRYAEKWPQAQQYYQRAATLAPGHGHAMNQLAVVLSSPGNNNTTASNASTSAAANDPAAGQRAVALYWYARSLSVQVPFSTARTNVVRLWESNRAFLQQLESSTTADDNNTTNSKSALSRRFLAHFLQLHDVFFYGLSLNRVHEEAIYEKMHACVGQLQQLLQNATLGDSLLCKMVTIQAFSECFVDRSILAGCVGGNNNNNNNNAAANNNNMAWKKAVVGKDVNAQQVAETTGLVARTLTLQLGTELAKRVILLLQAANHSDNDKKPAAIRKSSLRLLMPLLLLAEYVYTGPQTSSSSNRSGKGNEKEQDVKHQDTLRMVQARHEAASNAFWQTCVVLWNQLQPVATTMGLALDDDDDDSAATTANEARLQLKEYQNLRGFIPFGEFLPSIPADTDGVLTAQEASLVFQELEDVEDPEEQHGSGGSNKSKKRSKAAAAAQRKQHGSSSLASRGSTTTTGGSTSNANDQNTFKVARFLWLAHQLAAADDETTSFNVSQRISYNQSKQQFEWDAPAAAAAAGVAVVPDDNDQVMQEEEEEEEEPADTAAAALLEDDDHVAAPVDKAMTTEPVSALTSTPATPASVTAAAAPTLVYHQPDSGGPALLVPSNLLGQTMPPSPATTTTTAMHVEPTAHHAPAMPAMPAAATSTTTPMDLVQPLPPQQQATLGGGFNLLPQPTGSVGMQQPPAAAAAAAATRPVLPPPGFGGLPPAPPGVPPPPQQPPSLLFPHLFAQQQQPTQPPPPVVAQSFDLFGALQTSNPFVNDSTTPSTTTTIITPNDPLGLATAATTASTSGSALAPRMLSQDILSSSSQQDAAGGSSADAVGMDGTPLLDSSLLTSLLMGGDDTTNTTTPAAATKNPFAA